MTRECAIAAIVGLIVLTSLLTIGGFPPAIAVAIAAIGGLILLTSLGPGGFPQKLNPHTRQPAARFGPGNPALNRPH